MLSHSLLRFDLLVRIVIIGGNVCLGLSQVPNVKNSIEFARSVTLFICITIYDYIELHSELAFQGSSHVLGTTLKI